MARFIAEDALIVLVSCCSLLFEGGWERDDAVDLRSMPRHQVFNSVLHLLLSPGIPGTALPSR